MKTPKIILLTLLMLMPATAFANPFDVQMNVILENYLKIQKLLASDQTTGVPELAKEINKTSKKLNLNEAPENFVNHYRNVPAQIQGSSLKMSQNTSIQDIREAFKELSKPVANWAEMAAPKDVNVYFCSMAKASWVQKSAQVANPYYGQKMLGCGELVKHHQPNHDHKHQ